MPRIRLDWSRPCLPQAARHLLDAAASPPDQDAAYSPRPPHPTDCDLSRWWLVLPGRRAGTLMLDALLREAEQAGRVLIPPRTLTPGALVDAALDAAAPVGSQPLASPHECVLAWARALADLDEPTRRHILAAPPESDDRIGWLALGRTLDRLHSDLAGGDRTFEDVLDTAGRMELFAESDRWQALIAARDRYRRILADAGLTDPHDHRRNAIDAVDPSAIEAGELRLALIGVVELNTLQRRLLHRLGDRVTVFTHGPTDRDAPDPPDAADRPAPFDDLGCVVESYWCDRPLNIPDDRITVADRPADQAAAVIDTIIEWTGPDHAAAVTVGLGDESLIPHLRTAGQWGGLTMRPASGEPMRRAAPYRLLSAAADWIEDRRFNSFAALLRHADVESAVTDRLRDQYVPDPYARRRADDDDQPLPAVADWLGLLDEYVNRHLHRDASGDWLGNADERRALRAVHDTVADLLAPLLERPADTRRPLSEWMPAVLRVLGAFYQRRLAAADESTAVTRDACRIIRDTAASISRTAAPLQPAVDAPTAVRLLLDESAGHAATVPRDAGSIELLGWLELHLDTRPGLIVAGVNDGSIPGAVTADPFLPDSLRSALGLLCNTRRYARDAYLLRAMLESRRHVQLITGRRSAQGDPLTPSRLLLSVDADRLARRVQRMTDEDRALRRDLPQGLSEPAKRSDFLIPAVPDEPPDKPSMRVTEFRAYLACPYRYWLQYILGLSSITDDAAELDPMAFGTLVHDVLEAFGRDESMRDAVDPQQIEPFVLDTLKTIARKRFGEHPPPAVRVQLRRLETRLRAFAHVQAEHRQRGWRIRDVERALPEEAILDIPEGAPMPLRGKFDRIDHHETDNAWMILDYKTTDTPTTLNMAYRGTKRIDNGQWRDLQLPLYRYLAGQLPEYEGRIHVAHFALPRQAEAVDIQTADEWTEQHFEDAVETARDIVRKIRRGEFPINPDYAGYDDFERICHVRNAGGAVAMTVADSQEAGPP